MAEYVVGEGAVYKDEPKVEVKAEVKAESTEVVPESKPEKKEDAHAAKARSTGWVDKDEWVAAGHDEEEWRPAREYNDRGELLKKISSQSGELKAIQKSVEALTEHNKRVYVAGYQSAIAELRAKKAAAIENADGAAVVRIEAAIDDQQQKMYEARNAPTTPAVTTITPAFQKFLNENPWYENPKYRKYAHGAAVDFGNNNKGASEQDVYDHITAEVKEAFPELDTSKRKAPPALDGEGRSATAGKSATKGTGTAAFEKLMDELPEDQARMARDLVKRKFITAEKYVEDYRAIGQGR